LASLGRTKRAPKRRRIRKLRLFALLVVLALLGLAAFTFGLLTAIAAELPSLDPSKQRQQANTYVYDSSGKKILAVLRGSQARILVDSEDISPWLKHAIVAVEDRRFYEHRGVDLRGILRAVWADISHRGVVQGGSTITQQFVKNAIDQDETTISRKLREAALAWQLERRRSKDWILTAYLNTVYFGNGAYGVEQASRIYFGHSADMANVTPARARAEAALLAGIPADPSRYDPVAHPRTSLARRNLVLRLMLQQGYLEPAEYRRAVEIPLPEPQDVRLPAVQSDAAPYFANYVTDQLVRRFHTRGVYGGGLRVRTTIDLKLQQFAREAIASELPPEIGPTAALVSLDANTGAVLAMVGGRNYHRSQFNLATQGERQPGSSFKPFVLAAALRSGISPSTTFVSHPVTIDAGGRLWQVANYESAYNGTIDLRQAIAYSDNSVFAQLTNVVGPQNVAATAKALGIGTPLNGYFSIGLGAEPATPLDMARAFAAFANGGWRMDGALFGNEPRVVDCLMDEDGNCTETNGIVGSRVLEDWQAATIDDLLQGVVTYGTGRDARLPGYAVAGKTGTTENYGDAWFVGYTPDIVTAVWVGYPDELRPMLTEYHGRPVAGGTYPALIWKAYMEKALAYSKYLTRSFPAPAYQSTAPAIVVNRDRKLRRDNGNCRNTVAVQLYVTAELETADCKPNEVDVPDVRGITLAEAKKRLEGQPLLATLDLRPARPGQRVGIVVGQIPAKGTLSAYDHVRLIVVRARQGVVPKLVGLPIGRAERKLAPLKLDVRVRGGSKGRVVAQAPRWGVAATPGMRVVLTVRQRQTAG
jgi:penicillin-binding protein 1A